MRYETDEIEVLIGREIFPDYGRWWYLGNGIVGGWLDGISSNLWPKTGIENIESVEMTLNVITYNRL